MNEVKRIDINITMATLIKIVLVAFGVFALFVIRDIVLVLIVSMILASAMDPLVDWLYRRAKFPRGLSVLLVYLVFISIIGLAIYFIIPAMVEQSRDLGGKLEEFRHELAMGETAIARVLNQMGISQAFATFGQTLSGMTDNALQATLGVFSGVIQVVAVLAITFYLISSDRGMVNLIRSFSPDKYKSHVESLTHRVQRKIGYWLLGQLLISTSVFLLTYILLLILGVKFALALALLAGLLEIVPYIGPILAAIPAIFVAFVQSPPLVLIVIAAYIFIQQFESYVLTPNIIGRTIGANPVVILLALLIAFKFAGILGMLIAVPMVGAISVFLEDWRERKSVVPPVA